MDKRLKYKSQHHKSPRGEHRQENLRYSTQQYFLPMWPTTARNIKEKINKWDFIKIKSFFMAKENIRKMKRQSTIWRIYFLMIPERKVWSPKYIRNSHNCNPERLTIQLKNGQRTWTDTSPVRTYRGPRDIWKDAQHH